MSEGFKVTVTDKDGKVKTKKAKKAKEPEIFNGFEVAHTDANGDKYTKDGRLISMEFDAVPEDKLLSKFLSWASCKLTIPGAVPNAWKLDTPLIQAYEIPNFLTPEECEKTIDTINRNLRQSGVSYGPPSTFRTSRTNHMIDVDPEWTKVLDYKMANILGVNPKFSEGIQGQRYDESEYFKEHCDWFDPNVDDPQDESGLLTIGQRTWTFMVYLNNVEEGGETVFRRINRTFLPRQGTAIVWNNLYPDGHGNPYSIHEAMPIIKGNKWVITKWFRSEINEDIWRPTAELVEEMRRDRDAK